MDSAQLEGAQYPAALVDWAGHHSGGVKRLLDEKSGQPNKQLLRTNLLSRLQAWANRLPTEASTSPRIVLLVGGPGNGKTEAIECTIRWLDESLGCNGRLVDELSKAFHPSPGSAVPRLARVDAGRLADNARRAISIGNEAAVPAREVGSIHRLGKPARIDH